LLLARWGEGGRGVDVCVCMYGLKYVRSMGVCMVLGLGLGRYSDAIQYNTIRKPKPNQTKITIGIGGVTRNQTASRLGSDSDV